ncbi:L,D-transpeptidase family protein [Caulobacter sp. 73W]|uniref:L,D-transpeptidase family protein n=1 Tax=Caulobacter sp. 73W TaxID=3161137 RepID=A0AB39KXD5_9CAUL
MSGLIQYAVFNPYWNVSEDIAQDRYAPLAVREGAGAIDRLGFEVLSDWTADAVVMPSYHVNWPAVAAGRASVRMRQKPGRDNMMGKVKLMLPNRLGIYLHDTPDKSVMAHSQRALSAGCVRLADALGLAGDLLGQARPFNGAQPETRSPWPRPHLRKPESVCSHGPKATEPSFKEGCFSCYSLASARRFEPASSFPGKPRSRCARRHGDVGRRGSRCAMEGRSILWRSAR